MRNGSGLLKIVLAGVALPFSLSSATSHAESGGVSFAGRCTALAGTKGATFGAVTSAKVADPGQAPGSPTPLPAHCDVFGQFADRAGEHGQTYAIRYHLRLPEHWNGKFFFQGGGGTNGEIGSALGPVALGRPASAIPTALARGYAVVSQDSGHDNRLNSDPARNGATAFGFDPQARADYGNASLAPVARAAKAIITGFYNKPITRSYFVGCSKGGEEGMVFAQQHPDMFDGIVAGAPGFALPRAAVEQTYEVQVMAALVTQPGEAKTLFPRLHTAFSDADMALVGGAVAEACDALDGVKDGIVGNFARCTTARVTPVLDKRLCTGAKTEGCLSTAQISALTKLMAGAKTSDGKRVYASWQWDAGIAGDGWRVWKIGSADGKVPALNVVLGGASLPAVFMVPPVAVAGDPQSLLDWQMRFDLDRDTRLIYATGGGFKRSAWQDVSAHSDDLAAFKAHGGKLIVPHGVSDPVFSVNDTIAWYDRVDRRNNGKANAFVRVFPVPGMAHCAGGPATDTFDAFTALVDWVEHGSAPDKIEASAGNGSPWPGRTRPLCAYPAYARYSGRGDPEKASSFVCSK